MSEPFIYDHDRVDGRDVYELGQPKDKFIQKDS